MARIRVWLYVTGPALGLIAILWVTLALAGSNGEDQAESPVLREAPDIPVASVILHHNFPDHPGGPTSPLASRGACDKDVDLTSTISGVVAVGTQDNTICTNAGIDTYTNIVDGEVYVVQAGGEEAAFTITHIAPDGTPAMIDQLSWPQVNTYTPDAKAFGGYVNRCVNDIRRRPSQPLIQWRFHPHTVHRDRRLRSTQGPSDA